MLTSNFHTMIVVTKKRREKQLFYGLGSRLWFYCYLTGQAKFIPNKWLIFSIFSKEKMINFDQTGPSKLFWLGRAVKDSSRFRICIWLVNFQWPWGFLILFLEFKTNISSKKILPTPMDVNSLPVSGRLQNLYLTSFL